jgi:hypothetical protein
MGCAHGNPSSPGPEMLLLPGSGDLKVEPELDVMMSIWHAWYMEFSGGKAMSSSIGHGNSELAV